MAAEGFTSGDPRKLTRDGYSKGVVVAGDAAGTLTAVPAGVGGEVLTVDAAEPAGVDWETGGGGGGTPSNTVVAETAFGQAPNAGAVVAYSRGDHTHGSPALGVAAGTAAAGNDTRIINAVQQTLVDAKGDLFAGTDADTVTRLPVGADGRVLTADSSQAAGLGWAVPLAGHYPPEGYGFFTLSAAVEAGNSSSLGSGDTFVARIWVPAGHAIAAVGTPLNVAGTYNGTGSPNQFAVYDDAGTQIGLTPDDATLWAGTGWRIGVLNSPIAAQPAGRFVRVLWVIQGFTGGQWTFLSSSFNITNVINGGRGVTNRRAVFQGGVTTPPASINPASYGALTGFLPIIGLADA